MAHHAEVYAQEGSPHAENPSRGAPNEAPHGLAQAPANAGAPPLLLMTGASILALVFGMIGACLALNLFENSSQAAASTNRPIPAAPRPDREREADVKALKVQVEAVSQRVDDLKDRIDALPKAEPSSGLAILQGQVADLTKAVREAAPVNGQVESVNRQLGQLSQDILALRHEIADVQLRLGKREPVPVLLPDTEPPQPGAEDHPLPPPVVETPRVETPASDDNERLWNRAVELFKKGKYKDALLAFDKLELAQPDDARVWYYAALCRGFTTNQWTDGTEDLAERGVDREQAGTPAAEEIDRTFGDLTTATGKDWLAAYRARVKKP